MVTIGAYESIFRPQGFIPADMPNPVTEIMDGTEDDFLTVDEELLEKPLANMKLEELKRYAELRKIDIKGLTRKEEIKAAIKAQGGASNERDDMETKIKIDD